MKPYLRDQVDWEQPFTAEEYARAASAPGAEALADHGLDAIYITNPADLTWLTSYDMIWYHLKNLTGLLVRADQDETVFFDGVGHTTIVSTTPEIREAVSGRPRIQPARTGCRPCREARSGKVADRDPALGLFAPRDGLGPVEGGAEGRRRNRRGRFVPGRGPALHQIAARGRGRAPGRRHRRRRHGGGARRDRRGRHRDGAGRHHHELDDGGRRRLSRHPHHAGVGPARRHPPQPAAAPQDQARATSSSSTSAAASTATTSTSTAPSRWASPTSAGPT